MQFLRNCISETPPRVVIHDIVLNDINHLGHILCVQILSECLRFDNENETIYSAITRTFNTTQEHPSSVGGYLMTDKENEEEVAESQKLSSRDKKEIKEGLCVTCAFLSFVVTIFMIVALVL